MSLPAPFQPQNIPGNGPIFKTEMKPLARIFTLIPLLIIVWLGWSIFNFFYGDQYFPNAVRGAYVTSTYIPTGANQGKNFLLTDGSFHYYYSNSTGGSYSSGTASIFNKIYYGFYQPGKAVFENRNIVNFSKETPTLETYWLNGKIWLVGRGSDEQASVLERIDPNTGKVELSLSDLEKKVPEFNAGILKTSLPASYHEDLNFNVELMDGSTWSYFPGVEKAFKNYSDYLKWLGENKTSEMTQTAQSIYLTSDTPKKIGRVTGPKLLVMAEKGDSSPSADYTLSHLLQSKTGRNFDDKSLKIDQPFGDKSFIEGEIIYQDSEYALIIHQQTAQDLSPRLLSLVNIPQATVTSITEEQMLPGMRVNSGDDFSSLFFIKDNLSTERSGNIILFKYRYVGTLAIDVLTGKVAWSINGDKL